MFKNKRDLDQASLYECPRKKLKSIHYKTDEGGHNHIILGSIELKYIIIFLYIFICIIFIFCVLHFHNITFRHKHARLKSMIFKASVLRCLFRFAAPVHWHYMSIVLLNQVPFVSVFYNIILWNKILETISSKNISIFFQRAQETNLELQSLLRLMSK